MILASANTVAKIANEDIYGGASIVNQAVIAASGGKVPCYAINGKRTRVKWVSVGSSCVIGRGVAASFLRRVGVNIDAVEAA